jgi:hypothetical protein
MEGSMENTTTAPVETSSSTEATPDVEATTSEATTSETVADIAAEPTVPDRRPDWKQKLDRILDAHRADLDASAQKQEAEDAKLREGESWDSILKNQPDDVQRAMKALRADYTRKTMALAKQRRDLEAAQAAIVESPVLGQLKAVAESAGEELNPWDPDSLNAGIERLVAAKLHSLLEPMQRQHQAQQARANYETFMDAHPELRTDTELRAEVRRELERNQALDLETAFWAVKGRRLQGRAAQEKADKARRRRALQAAGAQMANGTHVAESVAKVDKSTRERGDAWSIYSQLSRKG